MIALVTTTINRPDVLALYAKLDPEMNIIVAGDKKTDPEAEIFIITSCAPMLRTAYLSPDEQASYGFKCSELIGWNTDSRRNIAVLLALKWGADIILSVDDDMIPMGNFITDLHLSIRPFSGLKIGAPGYWFDHGQFTIPPARARGLPFGCEGVSTVETVFNKDIGVVQGIILGVPDADAVTAISGRPSINSASDILQNGFVADLHAKAVFNSQLTAFTRELAPGFFQFYKIQKRNTDIFASLVMRRVMREKNLYTFYGPPTGYHARKPRPLFNDLKAEMWGAERIVGFCDWLDELQIPKVPTFNMFEFIYKKMATLGGEWVEFSECAMAWMSDVESVL